MVAIITTATMAMRIFTGENNGKCLPSGDPTPTSTTDLD